jgi:hypothetical protein
VRAQLPLSPDLAHFAAFVFATTPRPVADAIEAHRRGLDEDPAGFLEVHEVELDEAVRTMGAEYLGVEPAELAMTDCTTMGLSVGTAGSVWSVATSSSRPTTTSTQRTKPSASQPLAAVRRCGE